MFTSSDGSSGDVQNDWTKMPWVEVKMWVATIDFMKAFDSITHNSIWDALKSCGIEHEYINLLKRRYKNQKATVMTDEESDMFEIQKWTKQGDPLSSLLFNTVLQMALKDDLPHWHKKRGMCSCLGDNDHDYLTNMRFADGVLLFASSKEQLQKVLCSTEKVGLKKKHPGKTKIFSNQSSNSRKEIEVDNVKVEMSKEESTKYLGQTNTFQQQETTEIKNRTRAVWVTFYKYKQELTSKSYLLRHRLRFFDTVVTPTWTTPQEQDPHKRARKNDPIDAAQNASPLHTNEQKTYKKRLKAKMKIK